ncbi:UNVERIFIED_CONTAM: hypothetical protein Slati_2396900 [Sesamum latifolium]|uniref:DUF4283 domain-containing protein n=1 Tax=Sesamum latifolium TaxID=2727402 RepID=A0AAW2WCV4_9LAMI
MPVKQQGALDSIDHVECMANENNTPRFPSPSFTAPKLDLGPTAPSSSDGYGEVIEDGPWLFQGQPIVLQRWEPGLALRKHKHTQVRIWIKLQHLPVEFWTNEGFSTVASGIGRPLYLDAITKACMRLDFARVCVCDAGHLVPVVLILSMNGFHRNAEPAIVLDINHHNIRQPSLQLNLLEQCLFHDRRWRTKDLKMTEG